MHGAQEEDAVGGDPAGIDLRHPIVRLSKCVIGITRTRPVAERHRRRHARLARVNDLPRLLGERREIEEIDVVSWKTPDGGVGRLRQPASLGNLAGASMFAARGPVDDEHARTTLWIAMTRFRFANACARVEPFSREFE